MARVGHQAVAVQANGEQPFAKRKRFLRAHAVDPRGAPDRLGCLDDERTGPVVEPVGMRLEPAPLGRLERKGERVKQPMRAEPYVPAFAALDFGLKHALVLRPDRAVETVAGDDQVAVVVRRLARNLGLEDQPYAELLAALLQDVQQPLPADAAKAMATRGDRPSLEVHIDVIPVTERSENFAVRLRIRGVEVAQRLIREHDTPAEGVVRAIALDDRYIVSRVGPLHEQRQVQAGGPPSDADDAHLAVDAELDQS